MRPNVMDLVLCHLLKERHQFHQLIVIRIHEPALDRDPIVDIVAEGLRRVVDDDCLGQIPAQDVKILDVVAIDTDAVLSEEPIFDPFPTRVKEVQELVCVHLL